MEKKVTDLTMLKLSYFKNIKTFQKIQNKKNYGGRKKTQTTTACSDR